MCLIVQSEKFMTITVWRHMGKFQVQLKPESKQFWGDSRFEAAAEVASSMADWALPQVRSERSLKYRVNTIAHLAGIVGDRWCLPCDQDRADAEKFAIDEQEAARQRAEQIAEKQRAAEEAAKQYSDEVVPVSADVGEASSTEASLANAAEADVKPFDWREHAKELYGPAIDASGILDPYERGEYLEAQSYASDDEEFAETPEEDKPRNWLEAVREMSLESSGKIVDIFAADEAAGTEKTQS
jgi:hypothetical protein